MASQPASPANVSSDGISPAAVQPTASGLHPGRHTSPPVATGIPAAQPASGGQATPAGSGPISANLSAGVGGGSNGGGGPSSGGGGPSSGGYNQQEVRYSGTELVMLYDYKVRAEQRISKSGGGIGRRSAQLCLYF
jgi:hypothetical protein